MKSIGSMIINGLLVLFILMSSIPALAQSSDNLLASDISALEDIASFEKSSVLSGSVTDGDGQGVSGVTVWIVSKMEMVYLPLVIDPSSRSTARDTSSNQLDIPNEFSFSSQTDAFGNYFFSSLPDGTFTVYAELNNVVFTPNSKSVSVPTSTPCNFQVTIRTPVVDPSADIITEATNQYLESVSEDGVTFAFSQTTTQIQSILPGDIIVSGVSDRSPAGYLRRVVAVDSEAGKVVLVTEPAVLEDFIEDGSVFVQETLTPADIISTDTYQGIDFQYAPDAKGTTFSYIVNDLVLVDLYGDSMTENDQIKLEGKVDFDLGLDIWVDIENNILNNITFAGRVETDNKLEVYSELELAGFDEEWIIASHTFSPITIFVSAAPVVFLPRLDVVVGADGSINVGWSTSVPQELKMRAGVEYLGSSGWHPIGEFSSEFTKEEPQAMLEATLKAIMGCS
ncbi:MAG: hypothetical protein CL609_08900 [Anaerolineaceae bacterium]|nr:hypothetical protein [Anaerolineaceae bacterium]